ncbi:hypothetical protein [Micromonospora sp. NPDC126480]|uniref:HAAS signaling domain-containing protein n=1 Tax=Micromonospora sp. NPDC126480 TaxID=3155312 RepID=UPI00331E4537
MTVSEQEINDYVARVRSALADLPPAVRDELTEDLPEHLAVVAAEAGGSLVERLGAPEAYAVELRAAAGVGAGRRRLGGRLTDFTGRARAQLRALDKQLGPPLGYATVREFLRLFAPGWWVLRAYLAAMLLTVVSTGGSFGLLPRVDGNVQAGLMVLAALVVASVALGRRGDRLRTWPRRGLVAGNVVLVVFALSALANAEDRLGYTDYWYDQTAVDGRYEHIRDVFVYDSEGRLVENARLFDQNGDPIRLGYPDCPDLRDPHGTGNPLLRAYPYCPEAAPFGPRPTSAGSRPVLPPLPVPSGDPRPSEAPTASPAVTPSGAASPSPAATPSAEPTG